MIGPSRRLASMVVAVAAILMLLLAQPAAGQARTDPRTRSTAAPSPPYLTLLYSRTQWISSQECAALPNTISLRAVAVELQRRGLSGTGTLVTGQTQETTRLCLDDLDVNGNVLRPGGVLYASWADAAALRRELGWRFVSHSRSYRDMTTLTPAEQRDEACGSLADLRAHGHYRGDGLFAYPNNHYADDVQADVVATCFAYGRRYGPPGLNTRASSIAPWYQVTVSVNGGNCNIITLPCYTFTAPRRYTSPTTLGDRIAALTPDQWFVLQHYRFVRGAVAGRWDCRATDWRQHWTGSAEEYCWNDYLRILDRIPPAAVVTDPRTVAQAWKRLP